MWCSGGGGKEGEDRTSRNSPLKGFCDSLVSSTSSSYFFPANSDFALASGNATSSSDFNNELERS